MSNKKELNSYEEYLFQKEFIKLQEKRLARNWKKEFDFENKNVKLYLKLREDENR